MTQMIKVITSASFDKDFKKLSKRYRSLPEDLKRFQKYALLPYHQSNQAIPGIFVVQGVKRQDDKRAFIAKKFACRTIANCGNRSGIRITYIYDSEQAVIELREIFYKEDQAVEDKSRLVD